MESRHDHGWTKKKPVSGKMRKKSGTFTESYARHKPGSHLLQVGSRVLSQKLPAKTLRIGGGALFEGRTAELNQVHKQVASIANPEKLRSPIHRTIGKTEGKSIIF